MRKPTNKGTQKHPQYVGSIRYRGVQRWVKGAPYTSARAWDAAVRRVKDEIDKELDGATALSQRTIKSYCEQLWLELNPRPKHSSNEKLAGEIKPFVAKYGHLKFDYFANPDRRLDVRVWMSKQTVGVVKTCRNMWNDALDDGAATAANPFAKPGINESPGRKHITVLTEDEVELLGQCAMDLYPGRYGEHLRAIVMTAAYTGIRPGELFCLRWHRLRLLEQEADIHRIFDGQGHEIETDPKTDAGYRTVVVPQAAVRAIQESPKLNDDFIFVASRGRPFLKNTFVYYWHPLRALFLSKLPETHHLNRRLAECKSLGEDPNKVGEGRGSFHFYELRHFALTRLLDLGEWNNGMAVARQAGHRDTKLLFSTYGHPDDARFRAQLKEQDALRLTDEDLDRLTSVE